MFIGLKKGQRVLLGNYPRLITYPLEILGHRQTRQRNKNKLCILEFTSVSPSICRAAFIRRRAKRGAVSSSGGRTVI